MFTHIMIGILLANFHEWWIHRYILHGLGKNKNSLWHFHWQHHKNARSLGGLDHKYAGEGYPKERLSLFIFFLVHLPIFYYYPVIGKTLFIYLMAYYFAHKKSHLDDLWAKKYVPWHYDHHMGPDQDKNWCIVLPIFDYIMGTRKK